VVMQMLKQNTSRQLRPPALARVWQVRYYDYPVWTEAKRIEKLKYIHRNPVHRGLVARPEDWPWSSYRHYATGEVGTVRSSHRSQPGNGDKSAKRTTSHSRKNENPPLKLRLNG